MQTWIILIISLVAAILIGCISGVVIGKHQLKKSRSSYKPLLSKKERVVYSACLVFGTALILFGIFFKFPVAGPDDQGMNSTMPIAEDGLQNQTDTAPVDEVVVTEGAEAAVKRAG